MVLFHFCYDLLYLANLPLGFFHPPLQDIWRASISWTFLFVAGCMCALSRNGLKRALRYLSAAAAIYVASYVAAVDVPISFGIIFCMGASTLLECLLSRMGLRPKGWAIACLFFVLFLALLHLSQGRIGFGPITIDLPRQLYAYRALAFLGLPGPDFASSDYYPILPYSLMYLTGASIGHLWHETDYPSWASMGRDTHLAWIGRHALEIYLLHQPVLLFVTMLIVQLSR